MSEVIISPKAYIKMIFHAGKYDNSLKSNLHQNKVNNYYNLIIVAKYPHLAVNGLLLGSKVDGKSKTEVVDAVPLFHQCLYVSPMSEVALVQVESRASKEGHNIVGYYTVAENFYENTIDKAPGLKIAEKILENNNSACVVMVSLYNACFSLLLTHLLYFSSITNLFAWI